jgi:hypothetical protein
MIITIITIHYNSDTILTTGSIHCLGLFESYDSIKDIKKEMN